MYVLKRDRDGAYVARFGSHRSYTRELQNAQTFRTKEEAARHACVDERIVSIDVALGHTHTGKEKP